MDQEIDAAIDEQDLTDIGEPTAEELAAGNIDYEARYKETLGIAKRRTTALKKAKEALGKVPKVESVVPTTQEPKKGEIGYGEKAYLNSLGFKDAEDHTYVQGIMTSSGKSLEDVLAMPFVQGELKRIGEERITKAATPSTQDGRQGTPARDSVEYWIAKGELPPVDQQDLRRKVVNAKIAKEQNSSQFTSTPVVGGSK